MRIGVLLGMMLGFATTPVIGQIATGIHLVDVRCSVKPYFSNRFGKTASTFSASSLCWKHKMASSAKRIS
jgi:hypothetical protein